MFQMKKVGILLSGRAARKNVMPGAYWRPHRLESKKRTFASFFKAGKCA